MDAKDRRLQQLELPLMYFGSAQTMQTFLVNNSPKKQAFNMMMHIG